MSHRLQLFDSPETLGDAVASFLLEGYLAGEHLLVIAKPRHRDAIFTALKNLGCFPPDMEGRQRLIALDAADVLRQITRNGAIDRGLFLRTVKPILRTLGGPNGLRIYGEVVELLAEEGDLGGAMVLESLWNDLATEVRFSLMCGYSSAHFMGQAALPSLRHICETHTQSIATAEDPLGSYLLALA